MYANKGLQAIEAQIDYWINYKENLPEELTKNTEVKMIETTKWTMAT